MEDVKRPRPKRAEPLPLQRSGNLHPGKVSYLKLPSRTLQAHTLTDTAKQIGRKTTLVIRFKKPPLPNISLGPAITARIQSLRDLRVRSSMIIGVTILVAAELLTMFQPYFVQRTYALGAAGSLLSPVNEFMADKLKLDAKQGVFNFNQGYSYTPSSDGLLQNSGPQITAAANQNPAKGITVTDPVNNVDLTMTPKFKLMLGQKDGNRVIYPLSNGYGWLVESMHSIGVKEDILLDRSPRNHLIFNYRLGLERGALAARIQSDGSLGIYGNTLFSGNVATGTNQDAALLQKARINAPKNTLLFDIPPPKIRELGKTKSDVKAKYTIKRNNLRVTITGLKKAHYPLTIDPSIYVETAEKFMYGNNETNVDFDVADTLIEKGKTTGARFNSWNATKSLNTTTWRQGVAVAGGVIYTVGGTHPNGGSVSYTTVGTDTFTVPSGITSITVKAWGAGGAGGGGGNGASSTGGAGGGAGYAQATISGLTGGQTLNVTVGGAGGAGTGSTSSGAGGGGGGYSSIDNSGTYLVVAAGGAGGGGGGHTSNAAGAGGPGGCTSSGTTCTGSSGSSGNGAGAGGTTGAGGSGGTGGSNSGSTGSSLSGGAGGDGRSSQGTDGSANNGGSGGGGDGGTRDVTNYFGGGGGGGGGEFGGGGGSGSANGEAGGGGGGGSSFTCTTGCSGQSTNIGSGRNPGNNSDPDRGTAGQGGTAGARRGNGGVGTGGKVLITYSGTGNMDTVSWAKFNTDDGTIVNANPGTGDCSGWCTDTAYSLPASRASFSLVAYNGFLYAIGGEDSSCTTGNGTGADGVCKTVYIAKIGHNGEPQLWSPTSTNKSTWTYWYRDSDLSSPRSFVTAVAYENRMYLLGGKTSSGGTASLTNTAQIADITPTGQLGSWSSSTTLPYYVYGYGAQVYNNNLYLIGGASNGSSTFSTASPTNTVYYNKINSDGTLNSWDQTTSFAGSGKFNDGGNFTAVWGGYIYISGGCSAMNSSGYCTSVDSDTQLASINADGSLDQWNTNASVSDTRMGQNLVTWRGTSDQSGGTIYELGGCTDQNTSDGTCLVSGVDNSLSDVEYGTINQDGDASTVSASEPSGTAPCSGASPTNCNMPPTSDVGEALNATAIMNGYLYVIGGCTSTACSSMSGNTVYGAISSDGTLGKPATCTSGTYYGAWCVDNIDTVSGGVGAPGVAIFDGRIYLVGGLTGGANKNTINYTSINTDGTLGGWTSENLSSGTPNVGATLVSYDYAYARANPSSAGTFPGNLYIFGGCTASSAAGCTAYTPNVYKCNINTDGSIDTNAAGHTPCTETGQQQIGIYPGDTQPGLGIMCGTVYANYIYLIGGVTPNLVDLKTLIYAKFDNNNNIVSADGSGSWVEAKEPDGTPIEMANGRRRGSAFGYNGYIYVVGGYDAATGVLADIEFIKVNVSDGSLGDYDASGDFVSGFNVSAVTLQYHRWGLSVPVSNSYAYVIGGCDTGASPTCGSMQPEVETFQVYNNDSGSPAAYSTSANTYGSSPNRVGVSSAILNGYIYAAGGCTATDCSSVTNDVSYAALDANGNVGSWTSTTGHLPATRAWGKLEAAGGTLYYIGGQDNTFASQSTVYYATPSSGNVSSWSTATDGLPASRTQFGAAVWNNRLYVVGGDSGNAGSVSYTTGGTNTFTVPTGVTSITVKAWGAGGGGGGGSGSSGVGGGGGGGGFAQATISVTPGWSLNVSVGSGGNNAATNSDGGNGGGFSAVQHSGTYLIQAGGGGGGGGTIGSTTGNGGDGGAGGGLNGVTGGNGGGTSPGDGGGRGTNTAGGAAGAAGTGGHAGAAGIANAGGDAGGSSTACTTNITGTGDAGATGAGGKGGTAGTCEGGGGGGGGRFGGGGGGSTNQTGNHGAGGGGGGSDLVTGSGTQETAGSGTNPGNNGDASWNGYGTGGPGGTTAAGSTDGTDGAVLITFGSSTYNNTVYVSKQLNSGGNITGAGGWNSSSTSFNVGRSGLTAITYANNLYILGGFDGSNYLSDVQYAQISTSDGSVNSWNYSTSLPNSLSGSSGFAVNGYMYLIGGRSAATTCDPVTLVAPISANTTIASGNNPTGVGDWYQTNAEYTGSRYGDAAAYSGGKAYVLGGACGSTFASPVTQQTAVLSQPQVAQYSIMFDTDSDVYPEKWLLNGLDNSIGAEWQLSYRSMKNITSSCLGSSMTTWGQTTNVGSVTLGAPGAYTALDGSGTNTTCARFYYLSVSIDSSEAYGYPDDVTRGPTITDLTLEYEANPSKRLMHGRTFTGGLQEPDDTPF
jgi:hypothetical protein